MCTIVDLLLVLDLVHIIKSSCTVRRSRPRIQKWSYWNHIEVILYDKNNNKTNIVADYAISYSNSDLIDLRGNVIISTHLKDTLITDQLYYDRGQEWLFTNFDFRYVSLDKDIFGKGFDSDKSFEKIKFLEVNGFVSLDE